MAVELDRESIAGPGDLAAVRDEQLPPTSDVLELEEHLIAVAPAIQAVPRPPSSHELGAGGVLSAAEQRRQIGHG